MHMLLKTVFGAVSILGLVVIASVTWLTPEVQHSASVVPAASARAFHFRSLRTGTSLAQAMAAGVVANCREHEGETTCYLAEENVAGAPATGSGVYFDRSGMFTGFDVYLHHSRFAQVSDALTSAYGDTCRFDVKRLRNAFNADFPSIEAAWCFDGGTLPIVERSSEDPRISTLSFATTRAASAPRTFRPAEL